MPPFQAVRPEHVLLALEEFDRIGADEFLARYGFDHAGEFELLHNDSSYDSLAVLGVAHLRATGELAPSEDLSVAPRVPPRCCAGSASPSTGTPSRTPPTPPSTPSEVGDEAARSAWAAAARDVLIETAHKYHAVITSKELAAAVMERSKITTKRPSHYWIARRARPGRDPLRRARRAAAVVAVRQRRGQRRGQLCRQRHLGSRRARR